MTFLYFKEIPGFSLLYSPHPSDDEVLLWDLDLIDEWIRLHPVQDELLETKTKQQTKQSFDAPGIYAEPPEWSLASQELLSKDNHRVTTGRVHYIASDPWGPHLGSLSR